MRVLARIWQEQGRKDMIFQLRGQIVPLRKIERWIKRREGKPDSSQVENHASEGMIFRC